MNQITTQLDRIIARLKQNEKTCKGKVYQRAWKPRCRDKFNKFSCGSCGYGYRTFKKSMWVIIFPHL